MDTLTLVIFSIIGAAAVALVYALSFEILAYIYHVDLVTVATSGDKHTKVATIHTLPASGRKYVA